MNYSKQPTMASCKSCNQNNRDIAKFCKFCGETIISAAIKTAPFGIDALVGLPELKEEISRIVTVAKNMKLSGKTLQSQRLHTILVGDTGTGKTKIANILPQLYFNSGITNKATAQFINAVDYAQFAKDLANNYKSAKGSILFIDNVHKLVPDGYTGGQITQLDKLYSELETNPYDPIVILSGLPEGFKDYLESNPDVKNKFRVFTLPTLSANDMMEIAKQQLKFHQFSIDSDAEIKLKKLFSQHIRQKDKSFGNGHLVTKIVDEILQNYYLRFDGKDNKDIIIPEDIKAEIVDEKTSEEIFEELGSFVGMDEVKTYLKNKLDLIEINKKDSKITGKKYILGEHLVLTGNPGTGKTTFARKLGEIFYSMGLLDRGHVIEVDRSKMVGQYIGETAKLVQKLCDDAIGGILLIDEAYTLVKSGTSNDFGQEAIDTLLKRMEDDRGKFMVIAAGYKDQMHDFIVSNPGLKSRFKEENFFHFNDYNPEQLLGIFKIFAQKDGFSLDDNASAELQKLLTSKYETRDKNFGNGRDVRNLYDQCRTIRAGRIKDTGLHDMIIYEDDIPKVDAGKDTSIDEALLELDNLIGLASVKTEIRKLIDFLEVEKIRSAQGEKKTPLNIHFVFKGNPGTGKTTVARILANIFKAIKLLPIGQLVEKDRKDLIGEYIGQTAPKTNNVIDLALGGVLFIDEAYTLVAGAQNDFGSEAIGTLLKRMEDDRGKFIVIAAGYSGEMDDFLESNPGLTSRFTKHIEFEDYSPDELKAIFMSLVAQKGLRLEKVDSSFLDQIFSDMYQQRDKNFANGRTVRNLFESSLQNQASRLAVLNKQGHAISDILTILTKKDITL